MEPHDEFTRLVMDEFRRAARDKDSYTVPWLDLDVSAFCAYREGAVDRLPDPYEGDPADRLMTISDQSLADERSQHLAELNQTYAQSVNALREVRRQYAPSEAAGRDH